MTAGKKTYAVIRAVYNNHHAPDDFERELDFVLSRKVAMVIIEPESLGEITWRWIRTGNWLHKSAVICGVAALTTAGAGVLWNFYGSPILLSTFDGRWVGGEDAESILVTFVPHFLRLSTAVFSALSVTTAGSYALFWQWDPCCKYQVVSSLASLPRGLTSAATCGGDKLSPTHLDQSFPAGLDSNGNSSNGSSALSHLVAQNGKSRSRPVISKNRHHPNGPPLLPVVLVHRDDYRRKLLHNTLAITSTFVAGYILFRWSKSATIQ
ncbi:unnamed protein product [Dicrocoelium dendriticum]|nr:unnamed protein product [Dicrocoelium dendriticum]